MKYGSNEWYRKRYQDVVKEEARLSYRDKVKTYLSFSLEELEKAGHPLYEIINRAYPGLDKKATLDEARILKLFDKVFSESSMKALEMLYKLDGSMNNLENEPDYDEIEEATVGIK